MFLHKSSECIGIQQTVILGVNSIFLHIHFHIHFILQQQVSPNCGSEETLDASTRKCVNPSLLPSDYCQPYCGNDGGSFNVDRKGSCHFIF